MGYIKDEVLNSYVLSKEDINIAKYFTTGFNVNYGDVINEANTKITVFILEPEDFIKNGFGIEKETLLLISHYSNMESRTIFAAEKVFDKYPFKNRVDNLCYFLATNADDVETWLKSFYSESNNSRIIIPFGIKELSTNKDKQWFIRDRLRKYSFDKDLLYTPSSRR